MFLTEINIYPVKSLGGISLKSSIVEEKGFINDRRWMLVDGNGVFLSQREHPKMARLKVNLTKESLIVSAGAESISIAFSPKNDALTSVKVWSSRVKAFVYEDEVNQWFSDRIGVRCRLVKMPEDAKRIVSPGYAVRKYKDTVSFADGYPYLLISRESLDDLNSKLEKPLPMNRFRPNIVLEGADAFAEDDWKKIRIGETVFHVVKPCARCVMTTIDQQTGEKDGNEPLKTLAEYRNRKGKVIFGQNLIAENTGKTLKVGDKVEVLERKN